MLSLFSLSEYLTNRIHVVMHLFSKRSQVTSKCRKNKKVTLSAQWSVSLIAVERSGISNFFIRDL